jgi:hypothetical protein
MRLPRLPFIDISKELKLKQSTVVNRYRSAFPESGFFNTGPHWLPEGIGEWLFGGLQ